MKRREFDLIVSKLGLVTRQGDHLFAWFEHEGRVITRTRRSEKRGDLPMQHSIRQQLKLSEGELAELVGCTLNREGYVELLKKKRVI
jgi:hypothetical protein